MLRPSVQAGTLDSARDHYRTAVATPKIEVDEQQLRGCKQSSSLQAGMQNSKAAAIVGIVHTTSVCKSGAWKQFCRAPL